MCVPIVASAFFKKHITHRVIYSFFWLYEHIEICFASEIVFDLCAFFEYCFHTLMFLLFLIACCFCYLNEQSIFTVSGSVCERKLLCSLSSVAMRFISSGDKEKSNTSKF